MAGKEGFWRVDYLNDAGGGGWGIIVFDTGVIVGTDAWGEIWDGEYDFDRRSNLSGHLHPVGDLHQHRVSQLGVFTQIGTATSAV